MDGGVGGPMNGPNEWTDEWTDEPKWMRPWARTAAADRSELPALLRDLSKRAEGREDVVRLPPGRTAASPLHVVLSDGLGPVYPHHHHDYARLDSSVLSRFTTNEQHVFPSVKP